MNDTPPCASGATSASSGRSVGGHARALGPRITAVTTAVFYIGRDRLAQVDVSVDGVVITVLVRGHRVVMPIRRGEEAVRFSSPAVGVEVTRAAIEAAQSTVQG